MNSMPTRYLPLRTSLLRIITIMLAVFAPAALAAGPAVFINEIHYDNASTDTGEAVEIAGPAVTSLVGWSLVHYNGSNGALVNTTSLTQVITDQGGGFGVVSIDYPANGLQNGDPDGIALVNAELTMIQFLSWEGTFTAVGGPAAGMTSTDIGVSEPGSTPAGQSLQLTHTGTTYDDFTWAGEQPNTFGAFNSGQTFVPGAAVLVIAEFFDYDRFGEIALTTGRQYQPTAAGTFALVDPGVAMIGGDEIAVGLIYKPATVSPVGNAGILDSSVDPDFLDTKNRPALAE